jgi:site-specific DNA recombinase
VTKKLRIVGYARVSTQRQAEEGFNLDGQIRQIKNYVEIYYENYELTILREDGQSAKTMDRPEMTKIISMIKNHKIDVLVIYTYDRLTRRLKDFIDFLDLLEENGVVLDSMREKFDTSTASGRFMAHMITAMAEWEEDTISERTLRGMREAAMKRYYIRGGKAPFGYARDPDDKHNLIIDEGEAETVREIFQTAADHLPLFGLVAVFEAEKRNGFSTWKGERLYKIIQDKIYYGVMTLNGIDYPVNIPPIITRELYEKANQTRKTNNYRSYDYVFKGFMYCGKCGNALIASGTRKKSTNKYYRYYRCSACKRTVSEISVFQQVEDPFTKREQEILLHKCYESAKRANARYALALEHLNVNDLFNLPETYIEEKSKELRLKQSELADELKIVFNSLKQVHFYKKTHAEMKKFLSENVESLTIDFRTADPLIKIEWKNESLY